MTSFGISTTDRELGDNSMPTAQSLPPSESVSLSDLIADAGPLPTDAALECIQRVAERLRDDPRCCTESLVPSEIWIDDNGEIWLHRQSEEDLGGTNRDGPTRPVLEHLARLAAFLTTANGNHLRGDFSESGNLPPAIATLAERLIGRDRSMGYESYAALVADTARLREAQPEELTENSEEAPKVERIPPQNTGVVARESDTNLSQEKGDPQHDSVTSATLASSNEAEELEMPVSTVKTAEPAIQIEGEQSQAESEDDTFQEREPALAGSDRTSPVSDTSETSDPPRMREDVAITPTAERTSSGAWAWLLVGGLLLALLFGLLSAF